MRPSRLLPLVALLAVVACGGDDTSGAPGEDGDPPDTAAGEALASDITRAPVDPTAAAPVVVRGTNNVTFGLLGAMYAGGDVVISPASVATAFAMAAAGADEATRAQLDAVFGYPPGEQLPAAMNTLTAQLVPDPLTDDTGDAPVFELANASWVHDGVEVGAAYLETLGAYYGAGVEMVDFVDQEATRSRINEWIAERTHDRIPELLAAPGLAPETRFALANAAYFKASWAVPFDEALTAPQAFTTAAGAPVQAPMMHTERDLAFVLDEDVVAVHLPYLGGEYAMTIAMPDDVVAFLASADHDAWAQLSAAATSGPVVLDVPRWEATTTADLAAPLTGLGLTVPGGSYPGIIEEATVGAVVHGANITVDELGTEAAAATVIAMPTAAPADPVEIRIGRPYVYAITHVPSGTILFAGVETDPTT